MAIVNSATAMPLAKLLPPGSSFGSAYASGIPVTTGYLCAILTTLSWASSTPSQSSTVLVVPDAGDETLLEAVAGYLLQQLGAWLQSFSPQGSSIPVAFSFVSYGDAYGIWNSHTFQQFLAIPDFKISPNDRSLPPSTPLAVVLPIANPTVSGLLGTEKWMKGSSWNPTKTTNNLSFQVTLSVPYPTS